MQRRAFRGAAQTGGLRPSRTHARRSPARTATVVAIWSPSSSMQRLRCAKSQPICCSTACDKMGNDCTRNAPLHVRRGFRTSEIRMLYLTTRLMRRPPHRKSSSPMHAATCPVCEVTAVATKQNTPEVGIMRIGVQSQLRNERSARLDPVDSHLTDVGRRPKLAQNLGDAEFKARLQEKRNA